MASLRASGTILLWFWWYQNLKSTGSSKKRHPKMCSVRTALNVRRIWLSFSPRNQKNKFMQVCEIFLTWSGNKTKSRTRIIQMVWNIQYIMQNKAKSNKVVEKKVKDNCGIFACQNQNLQKLANCTNLKVWPRWPKFRFRLFGQKVAGHQSAVFRGRGLWTARQTDVHEHLCAFPGRQKRFQIYG